ncbi:MAG: Mut7-C RNAse domain-containing protein [Elusimicrobiota bacterium]
MARPKFLVDCMLGRLARWLRIIGYDTVTVGAQARKRLPERSFLEKRVIVTREARLKDAHAYKVVFLRQQHWPQQLAALWKELGLPAVDSKRMFTRCGTCNRPLKRIAKLRLDPTKIPPKVYAFHKIFHTCPRCNKIFWPGSHLDLTIGRLKDIHIPQ